MAKANTDYNFGLFGVLPGFLILLSGGVLFAVGFGLAYPYGFVRHFSSESTECTVASVKQNGVVSCTCGTYDEYSDCTSQHPCVEIMVDYVSNENSSRVENATLYNNPFSYSTYKNNQCSTSACTENVAENNRTVAEFVRKYGVIGRTFPCYPGKDSDPEALLSIIEHWKVLLGMLLPAAIFITAGLTVICYCMVCPIYKSRRR